MQEENNKLDYTYNPAQRLRINAQSFPDKVAIHAAKKVKDTVEYVPYTYQYVEQKSDEYANFLSKAGIKQGDKTVIMVKPTVTLFSLVYALFKIGAIPVIVDPGMGIKRMLHSYKSTNAKAFIGIPIAHVIKKVSPKTFASLQTSIVVKGEELSTSLFSSKKMTINTTPFSMSNTQKDELAIINFTTGSTGPAKGVEYTYQTIVAMADIISKRYNQNAESIDLVTVILFGVLDLMFGATAILPIMDPTKPAEVHPPHIIDPIHKFKATYMFASPALINKVANYGKKHNVKLPSLKIVNTGGAPITMTSMKVFRSLMSDQASFFTTWGATEGLPLTTVESTDVINETSLATNDGKGNCIGNTVPGVYLKIIAINEDPIAQLSDATIVTDGVIGEIIVSGANISPAYYQNEKANTLHKIKDGETIWHRTGDIGWLDDQQRVWFCGRKAHRVELSNEERLFTCQLEGVTNSHETVYRSALIGLKKDAETIPVMCIEPNRELSATEQIDLKNELQILLQNNETTKTVKHIVFEDSFPVDIRHNSKIKREQLAKKYQERLDNSGISKIGKASSKFKYNHAMLIPIFGWLLIAWGIVFPFEHIALKIIWWIDIFLSVVVHTLQIFVAIPKGRDKGYSNRASTIYTFIFGATWWKTLEIVPKKK